jgi:hypothetical protein
VFGCFSSAIGKAGVVTVIVLVCLSHLYRLS